ncbi:MAG TPA: TRAP transporter small permease [Candidatus Pseudogracilibacillus intestinigallinarum]|uniref:TRAP transporter small permease n=1 Tax=Candidatus Pseudogracilibacillus intestinigallinarum TaxID=2838742 RepID=A0A9D1TJU2_9BACI|nr:TRAP transporter small permease [Candidatus Pseudogracilibacillus intestinigallinarum]
MWSKIVTNINKITELLTSSFLVIMVAIIFMQIVSRVLIQSSFPWTEELARFLMIWVTFLGAAFSFQHGAHIGISMLTDKLPNKLNSIVQLCIGILCTALFLVLLVKGIELVGKSGNQTSPAMSIPMNYVYLIIPISAVLLIMNVIDVSIKQCIKNWKGESV